MLPSRYIQDWAYAPVIVILSDRLFSAIDVGLNSKLVWFLQEKLGATSDSIPDMNEQNDGGGSGYKKQPDSDAQPGNESWHV